MPSVRKSYDEELLQLDTLLARMVTKPVPPLKAH